MKKRIKHRGLLSIEVVVALSVLITLAGVLTALGMSFGKLNQHVWLQHTCQTAGQSQMDAMMATGQPIDQAKFESLWPGVTCEINTEDGTGPWQGMTRVDLVVSAETRKDSVQIEMTCYVPNSQGGGHEN